MKVRKKMASILSVLTLTGFLAACGNGATEETGGTTSTEANGEKIELTFWYPFTGKIQEANEGLVEKFNESQDKIHVTVFYSRKLC